MELRLDLVEKVVVVVAQAWVARYEEEYNVDAFLLLSLVLLLCCVCCHGQRALSFSTSELQVECSGRAAG